MSKTPEQLAEDYAFHKYIPLTQQSRYGAEDFLAGFKAGKEETQDIQSRMDNAFDRMLQRAKGNSLEKPDGWISVKERLPELDKEVVIYVNFKFKYTRIQNLEVASFNGTVWNVTDDSYHLGAVSHWMPIPELPRDE